MPRPKDPEWDQVIMLMPGRVCSNSHSCLTAKYANDLVWLNSKLRLAEHTQSLEQQVKASPEWCSHRRREEEEESSGVDFSDSV